MIIDNEFINKYGQPPNKFTQLAEIALTHGKSFSQGDRCISINFIDHLKSWSISDNYCRGIYKSILYCIESNKFFVYSKKSMSKVSYNSKITPAMHAKQFFMPGIVDSLFID